MMILLLAMFKQSISPFSEPSACCDASNFEGCGVMEGVVHAAYSRAHTIALELVTCVGSIQGKGQIKGVK